jgi:hypothetical protein|tara:strand:- start:1538 stop:1741 length:204 start_codon:yes stop_codon:yes gene_type:complete
MSEDIREQSLSEFLKKRFRDIMNEHADHISTGSVKDYAEYKKLCGVIEGLALAEREMLDWLEQHSLN